MRLIARLADHTIQVRQEGGFGSESRAVLRSVSTEHKWTGSKLTWEYPFNPGTLAGLHEGAVALGANLTLDPTLIEHLRRIQSETDNETKTRALIQKYADNRDLKLGKFATQSVPPPWRHQEVAWHWAMRVRNIYLALKPGLGKTRIGSDIIRGRHELGHIRAPEHFALDQRISQAREDRLLPARWCVRGGVLVVCPRVVVGEWLEQLQRWQNIKAVTITGDSARKRYRSGLKAWVHICAYDSLESVEGNEYDGIIGDELHYIANEDSNRWRRMMVLRKHAAWVVGMSGTPIPNMLPSLWAQYYWLDGGRTLGPSFDWYRRRYFNTGAGRKLEEKVSAEERISQAISRVTMFLTMREAFPGKAEKIHQVIRVPLTTEQANYYERVRKLQVADILAGKVTLAEATTKLTKLLQITSGFVLDDDHVAQQFSSAKLKALEDMIVGQGDLAGNRGIIWCRFKHEIHMVHELLKRHGINHVVLDGATKNREQLRDQWNTDYRQRWLVGMIQMGIGINLHAPNCKDEKGEPARVSTTIFMGYDWKVTQLEQAMDRVYRGDQVETCLYRYILSDDLDASDENGDPIKTIDVRIYEALQEKLNQGTRVAENTVEYIRSLLAA